MGTLVSLGLNPKTFTAVGLMETLSTFPVSLASFSASRSGLNERRPRIYHIGLIKPEVDSPAEERVDPAWQPGETRFLSLGAESDSLLSPKMAFKGNLFLHVITLSIHKRGSNGEESAVTIFSFP